jgi:predicted O-linked N-acetylglucosamine transferase (SPINDLY family)
MEIDVAVDLAGFTSQSRMGIFAQRPVPATVSLLGYPGTMGTPHIDYIMADRIVAPPDAHRYFSEKIVSLPDTYWPADSKLRVAERTPTRAEMGLPEKGFVFCSFNNSFKFSPEMFAIWIRLLNAVEGSVLWLLEDNPIASRNLKREARERGIAPERLIFAPRMKMAEHLARQRLADLFLDTSPYNGHTTASDALWVGLPLVTLLGTTFAGRVGASLLHAAGLPELVADSIEGYQDLALSLARDPARLAALRDKLARNRDSCSLFDTARTTRKLEAAFTSMWQRHQRGEPPASFAVVEGR